MKITKNTKNGQLEFYRDMKEGSLRNPKSRKIWTYEAIKRLDIDKSLEGRILAYGTSLGSSNPFSVLIQSLIKESEEISLSNLKRETCNKENVQKYLSPYGRMLNYGKEENTSLGHLLVAYGNGVEIDESLVQIKNQILKLKNCKKKSLLDSFANNKIPFKIEDGELKTANEKMKWLFSFLKDCDNNDVNKKKFEQYRKWYNYKELKKELDAICDEHFSREETKADILAKKIYSEVQRYNCELSQRDLVTDKDGFSCFLNEVRDHFRKYFPATGKKGLSKGRNGSGDSRVASLADQKNVTYFYSDKYVFQQVWKRIVNQLVAGLIQYGKLSHYFYNEEDHTWQEDRVNSDGMKEIQVTEAFTKQLFLSVVWSVNRLNYFFQYGGDNSKMLYSREFTGDIIAELDKDNFEGFSYNNTIQKDRIDYIHEFMQSIKEYPEECEILFAKLSTSYPLKEEEKNPEDLLKILKEIYSSVSALRHRTIHYQKDGFGFKEREYSKSNQLLLRDINNVQDCFQEQIRSMNIAEYYSLELLKKVLMSCGLEFKLYASQVPMIPSFRKVFEKGVNLFRTDRRDENLKWYIENKKNPEAKLEILAYRNLLQLIYYHGFLPAVQGEPKLVTEFIDKTVVWNEKRALQKQIEKGQVRNQFAYRYRGMPKFHENMSLSEYMGELQRNQSNKEKENLEAGVAEEEKKITIANLYRISLYLLLETF